MSKNLSPQILVDYLPEHFEFYDQGLVTRTQKSDDQFRVGQRTLGLAYRIYGDWEGMIVLLIEQSLDLSMYSEIGNVIASRFASQLGDGPDTLISPPMTLDPELILLYSKQNQRVAATYQHACEGKLIPLRVWILEATQLKEQLDA
jgi:hypothetical protein